jgi:flagellar basal-body rod protein FlgG
MTTLALWTSKSGMSAQQTQLDVISHNLANVSTTGFKRHSAQFEDLMYQNLRQVGANVTEQNQKPTGLNIGLGVEVVANSKDYSQGALQQTSRDLDVAINGKGFFEVTMPDGTTGYTRDGSFQVDVQGRLVTNSGMPVGGGITIPTNAKGVSISQEGAVSVTLPGNVAPQVVGNIAVASFGNVDGLEPIGQNLYRESAASGQPQQGTPGTNDLGLIKQGFLEASNVNVVTELVSMIQTQRAYEMNSKAITTQDQMLAKLGQL